MKKVNVKLVLYKLKGLYTKLIGSTVNYLVKYVQ